LGDDPGLDVAAIGSHLALDLRAVGVALAVKVLISGAAGYWRHGRHPEVIAVSSHRMDRLLEGHLDFEAHTIEADDVQRLQGQVGGQENLGAAVRMDHGHEAHEAADGTPKQVHGSIAQPDIFFAIDGAGRLGEGGGLGEQVLEVVLASVAARPSASAPRQLLIKRLSDPTAFSHLTAHANG